MAGENKRGRAHIYIIREDATPPPPGGGTSLIPNTFRDYPFP
jgi:hypothetical protein